MYFLHSHTVKLPSLSIAPINNYFKHTAGETATFEVSLGSSPDSLTWLKDNKRMDELMADRATATCHEDNHKFKLEIKKCLESDSGTYTALAINKQGSSTCTAQLLVHQRK